jgi:hypothetical protein
LNFSGISPTNRHLILEGGEFKTVHERVSKKLIPTQHPSASALTFKDKCRKFIQKLEAIFLQKFQFLKWNLDNKKNLEDWAIKPYFKIDSICMVLVHLHLRPVHWIFMFLYLITHKASPQPRKVSLEISKDFCLKFIQL